MEFFAPRSRRVEVAPGLISVCKQRTTSNKEPSRVEKPLPFDPNMKIIGGQ